MKKVIFKMLKLVRLLIINYRKRKEKGESMLIPGVQSTFPHEKLKMFGCYFFALLKWAEKITGRNFNVDGIINLYEQAKRLKLISEDVFVHNPKELLNLFINSKLFTKVVDVLTPPKKDSVYIINLKKPGYNHFVLSVDGEVWDSLDPNRPAAKQYTVDSYRVIS